MIKGCLGGLSASLYWVVFDIDIVVAGFLGVGFPLSARTNLLLFDLYDCTALESFAHSLVADAVVVCGDLLIFDGLHAVKGCHEGVLKSSEVANGCCLFFRDWCYTILILWSFRARWI